MEKALEKIKEIIDFCDAVGCHRAIYESIKFVEKELEEAMKPKTCHWCKQSWEPNNQTFHKYFCNYLQRPTHGDFGCNRYEQKDTQC